MPVTSTLARPPVNPGIRMNTDPELFDQYLTLKSRWDTEPDAATERNLFQVIAELSTRGYTTEYVDEHYA